VKQLADLHVELVGKHGAGCSGFVCDNGKLRDFIAQNTAPGDAKEKYAQAIAGVRNRSAASQQELEKVEGMTLKQQEPPERERLTKLLENKAAVLLLSGVIMISMSAIWWGNHSRRKRERKDGLED
jgi:cobaltochelatase CobN